MTIRVLITGGAGFVGSHLVERLIARGDEVMVVDDLSSGSREHVPAPAQLFVCDIRDKKFPEKVLSFRPDAIVHAAAQMSVRASMQDPMFDTQVNVVGLVNLLDALRQLPQMPHVVFTSTGGAIYGEQDCFPAPEDHPKRPTSVYGLAKHVGEQYLDLWRRSYGLRFAALRLGNVYGPRQNPHGEAGVVAIFSQRLLAAQPPKIFGDGKQTRDFIFVGDVIDAIVAALDQRQDGTYNIGTGVETSVNALLAEMQRAAGTQFPVEYAETRLGEQLRSVIDPRAAQRELAWTAKTSLAVGLRQTFEWYRGSSV